MIKRLLSRKQGGDGKGGSERKQRASDDPKVQKRRRRDKRVLALAAAFILVGASLHFTAPAAEPAVGDSTQSTLTSQGVAPNSLVGTGLRSGSGGAGESEVPAAESGIHGWSPFFMKGGFSFIIGFAVGYAVRTFLKMSLLIAGVVSLAVFGLSYAGLVDVDWSTISGLFDDAMARVREEAGHFKTFVTGSLPSASFAAVGLLFGFRR